MDTKLLVFVIACCACLSVEAQYRRGNALHPVAPTTSYSRGNGYLRSSSSSSSSSGNGRWRNTNALHPTAPVTSYQTCGGRCSDCDDIPQFAEVVDTRAYYNDKERLCYQRVTMRLNGPYRGEIDNIWLQYQGGQQHETNLIETQYSCGNCNSCGTDDNYCVFSFDVDRETDAGLNNLIMTTVVFDTETGDPEEFQAVCEECVEVLRYSNTNDGGCAQV